MARRDGRAARQRSPGAAAAQGENANMGLPEDSPPRALARWTDERLMMVCQHYINAPACLYRHNVNWGKAVPPGVKTNFPSHYIFF